MRCGAVIANPGVIGLLRRVIAPYPMPTTAVDAALQATERQFIRLVGSCNRIAQFFVYPFSLPSLARSAETCEYIDQYYSRFEDLQQQAHGIAGTFDVTAPARFEAQVADLGGDGGPWGVLRQVGQVFLRRPQGHAQGGDVGDGVAEHQLLIV